MSSKHGRLLPTIGGAFSLSKVMDFVVLGFGSFTDGMLARRKALDAARSVEYCRRSYVSNFISRCVGLRRTKESHGLRYCTNESRNLLLL
jgi:hypothetical protein